MRLSSRHAVVTAILLLLALVPTVIHGYLAYRVDDGRRPSAVPSRLIGHQLAPWQAHGRLGDRRFDSADFVERWYGEGTGLRLLVVRTYDPKRSTTIPSWPFRTVTRTSSGRPRVLPDRPTSRWSSCAASGRSTWWSTRSATADTFRANPIAFQLRLSPACCSRGARR